MDIRTLNDLASVIDRIEAREALTQLTISSYPHMTKKQDKEKIHKSFHKRAFPDHYTQDNLGLISRLKGMLGQ